MNVQDRIFSKTALKLFERIGQSLTMRPSVVLVQQNLPKDKPLRLSATIKMKRRGM